MAEPRRVKRGKNIPAGAGFGVRQGDDSMEPWIRAGQVFYVSRGPMPEPGDVGLFLARGELVCRQYLEDSEGNIYLFVLNRARRELDITVPPTDPDGVSFYGRVLLNHTPPLPGIEE